MAYTPIWHTEEHRILVVAAQVQAAYPQDWAATNDPSAALPAREVYIRRVVWACRFISPPGVLRMAGANWKRGHVGDLSLDALACPNATGARDLTGRWAGIEIIDIIKAHGTSGAALAWTDQTQVTMDSGNGGGWVAPSDPDLPPVQPVPVPVPGREEALDELRWLHSYYMAPEGLQRPKGLWRDDTTPPGPDFEGIAAWYLDVYQQQRIRGASRAAARAVYVSDIRHSAEWRAKHPGETP